jgi:hypothetical protein
MKTVKYYLILLLGSLLSVSGAQAGTAATDTVHNPFSELMRIIGKLQHTSRLSFDVSYVFTPRGDTTRERIDLSGSYQLNNDSLRLVMDSVDIVQDRYYSVTLAYRDSAMLLAMPTPTYIKVLEVDVFDSVFLSKVDSITITRVGAQRTMNFVFKETAPYKSYEIVYDTLTHYPAKVTLRLKHFINFPGDELAHTYLNTHYDEYLQEFSNYQTGLYSKTVFNTNQYVRLLNGAFTKATAYSFFRLINQVNNNP